VRDAQETRFASPEEAYEDAMKYCIRFLLKMDRFTTEVVWRLKNRGIRANVARQVAERLAESGLVDDDRALAGIVRAWQEGGRLGLARLKLRLIQRHAPPALIEDAMAKLAALTDEEGLAYEVLSRSRRTWLQRAVAKAEAALTNVEPRLIGRKRREAMLKVKARLLAFLIGRGFGSDAARRSVNRLWAEATETN
jgi:SOS response regulatory protein OraA/RecX